MHYFLSVFVLLKSKFYIFVVFVKIYLCNFLKPTTQNCRENRIRIDETLHKKVLENRVVNIHLLRLLMTACDLITSGGLTCSTSYICISTNTVGNLFFVLFKEAGHERMDRGGSFEVYEV